MRLPILFLLSYVLFCVAEVPLYTIRNPFQHKRVEEKLRVALVTAQVHGVSKKQLCFIAEGDCIVVQEQESK